MEEESSLYFQQIPNIPYHLLPAGRTAKKWRRPELYMLKGWWPEWNRVELMSLVFEAIWPRLEAYDNMFIQGNQKQQKSCYENWWRAKVRIQTKQRKFHGLFVEKAIVRNSWDFGGLWLSAYKLQTGWNKKGRSDNKNNNNNYVKPPVQIHWPSSSKCVSVPSSSTTEHTILAFRKVVHLFTRLRCPPISFWRQTT